MALSVLNCPSVHYIWHITSQSVSTVKPLGQGLYLQSVCLQTIMHTSTTLPYCQTTTTIGCHSSDDAKEL